MRQKKQGPHRLRVVHFEGQAPVSAGTAEKKWKPTSGAEDVDEQARLTADLCCHSSFIFRAACPSAGARQS